MRRNVTLARVAEDSGVSIATVCKVLNSGNEDHRISARCTQRVLDSAKRLGYAPNYHAQAMKHGKSGVVAFAMNYFPVGSDDPACNQLSTSYFGSIFGAVEKHIRNLGHFTTVIGPEATATAPERGLLAIRQHRFDGMIVLAQCDITPTTEAVLELEPEPVVLVKSAADPRFATVNWDEAAGVNLAVQHLAELGHRELLWVGPEGTYSREQHFISTVWGSGLHGASCHLNGEYSIYVSAAMQPLTESFSVWLAQHGRHSTAVVCYNDVIAVGVWNALLAAGIRVPEDVSIIGFDDVIAWFAPKGLTSVNQMLARQGQRSAELLMEMLDNEERCRKLRGVHEVIQPKLTVRGSTSRVRTI